MVIAFSTGTLALDVHCDSYEMDDCFVKEILDIHEPTVLNFIDAEEWNDAKYFTIPSHSKVSVMPSGIFTRFLKIKRLRASTGLKSIRKEDFSNANVLKKLELQDNKLEIIPREVFSEAVNLEKIDLRYNQITSIEDYAFIGLSDLEYIWLQHNNLTSLKRNTFAGAEDLETIGLNNNQISSIEDGTFVLPDLKSLYLWENSIHSLSDDLFVGAPKLSHLSLSQNGLTHIGQSLYKLNKLKTLLLDDNKVEDMDFASFAKMPKLKTLSLKNTGFSFEKLPDTPASLISSVTYLDISNNGLSNSDILNRLERLGLVNLKRLNLDGNLFTDIEGIEKIKQRFPQLVQLGLSDNKLTCEWIQTSVKVLASQNISVLNNYRVITVDAKNFNGTICV